MRILYYGHYDGNSGSRVKGMTLLGHDVRHVYFRQTKNLARRTLVSLEWRLCNGPITVLTNWRLVRAAREFRPELVWTEMGRLVYAGSLRTIKRELGCPMVNSYSDDFLDPMKRSRHYERSIPIFDHIFTPREGNFPEFKRYGARQVHKFWKGYNPELHFPERLSAEELKRYGADVVFAGHAEPTRIQPLNRVAQVAALKVWGDYWERFDPPEPLRSCIQFRRAPQQEYRKALCGAKIGIQYLSRWARDTQASRSFEIPACGVFMLADRTEDHQACFEEGKEADYFSSDDELADKVRFYLTHGELRRRIAEAGYRRCLASGYSNLERVRQMLERVIGAPQRFVDHSPASPALSKQV